MFVDRNPSWFEHILDALREPAAIADLKLTDPTFQRELEFYGLAQVRTDAATTQRLDGVN